MKSENKGKAMWDIDIKETGKVTSKVNLKYTSMVCHLIIHVRWKKYLTVSLEML